MRKAMDKFKRIPYQVIAKNNMFNSPQEVQDSQGNPHVVPATWWLVEAAGTSQVWTMSDEAFRAQYESDVPLATLEGFAASVQELRSNDRMATQRAMELEARIAALEGILSQGGTGPDAGVVGAIMRLQAALASAEARVTSLESIASSMAQALAQAQSATAGFPPINASMLNSPN
jgi:hypothetical protein